MTCLSDCPYGTAIYRSMPWLMARKWHGDLGSTCTGRRACSSPILLDRCRPAATAEIMSQPRRMTCYSGGRFGRRADLLPSR